MKPLKFSEQVGSIEKLCNMINVGRGSISYINLAENDPKSERPACLFVASKDFPQSQVNFPRLLVVVLSIASNFILDSGDFRKIRICWCKATVSRWKHRGCEQPKNVSGKLGKGRILFPCFIVMLLTLVCHSRAATAKRKEFKYLPRGECVCFANIYPSKMLLHPVCFLWCFFFPTVFVFFQQGPRYFDGISERHEHSSD